MSDKSKKIIIWSAVAVLLVVTVIVVTKAVAKAKSTIVLPVKGGVGWPLPEGLMRNSQGNIITTDGYLIKTFDPNTGAYQEADGTWYSNEGLPLSYYDTATGNYMEEGDTTTLYDKYGSVINEDQGLVNTGVVYTKPKV